MYSNYDEKNKVLEILIYENNQINQNDYKI